jgi:ABC-type sugar transport system ATPase subunit
MGDLVQEETAVNYQPLIEIRKVTKTFPGVVALSEVDFELRPGEIHALIGENGAGKSTLMKIISGIYAPDSGDVVVKGKPVPDFRPDLSRKLGIATVFQELSLVPYLTVEENMLLGREPLGAGGLLNIKERQQVARKYLDIVEAEVSLTNRLDRLSVAQQQMVEIAKALSLEPEILIMDEPTSKLFGKETEVLFGLLKQLSGQGKGIIYITHRLEEVPRLATRVTVFRDGELIETLDVAEAQPDRMIKLMVGRELTQLYHRSAHNPGEELVRVEDLAIDNQVDEVNFSICQGEIVGLTGLIGSGCNLVGMALAGVLQATRGRVYFKSTPVHFGTPRQAKKLGIAFIPEDRRAHSLVMSMSVRDNIFLASLYNFLLHFRTLNTAAQDYVDKLTIRTPSIHTLISQLSGGNQQKVAIAKWLYSQAKLLILDEPTQGIDVGAKAQIYALLDDLARQGVAILLISSDMKEVLGMCDRIFVMRKGRLTGHFQKDEATQEKILRSALIGQYNQ